MATRPATGVLLKKKTTTTNITPPHIPPRRSDAPPRRERRLADRAPLRPRRGCFAFGLSGFSFSARSSDAVDLDLVPLLVVGDEVVLVAERLLAAAALLAGRHQASA